MKRRSAGAPGCSEGSPNPVGFATGKGPPGLRRSFTPCKLFPTMCDAPAPAAPVRPDPARRRLFSLPPPARPGRTLAAGLGPSLALAALLGGCGDAVPEAEPNAVLVLGADTFALVIERCDLSGSLDEDGPMLLAGLDAPGGRLVVTATRAQLRGSLLHTLSVRLEDGGDAGPEMEALHVRSFGAWSSPSGGPEAPLFRIEGDRVTAESRFAPPPVPGPTPPSGAPPIRGTLKAHCPPPA